jgi:hypothetical protein
MDPTKISKPPSENLIRELALKDILHKRKVEARQAEKGA